MELWGDESVGQCDPLRMRGTATGLMRWNSEVAAAARFLAPPKYSPPPHAVVKFSAGFHAVASMTVVWPGVAPHLTPPEGPEPGRTAKVVARLPEYLGPGWLGGRLVGVKPCYIPILECMWVS